MVEASVWLCLYPACATGMPSEKCTRRDDVPELRFLVPTQIRNLEDQATIRKRVRDHSGETRIGSPGSAAEGSG